MAVFSSSKNEILLIWFHHLAMSQVCFVVQQKPIHKGIQLAVFFLYTSSLLTRSQNYDAYSQVDYAALKTKCGHK